VPGFDSIIDQQRPIKILTTLLHRGNIPHALLFTGIDGIGKKSAARAMAMATNCLEATSKGGPAAESGQGQGPEGGGIQPAGLICGRCAACRKIESGSHPDVHWLKPSGAVIKIGQIRELAERVALKPYEARTRVIMLIEAHKMNAAAANALLKMLEEPPPSTLFVLTAPQPGDLLPTVASRCQHVRFHPLSRAAIAAQIGSETGIADQEALAIAALAGGSIEHARVMVETDWLTRRAWLIQQLMTASVQTANRLLALAEFISPDTESLGDALDVIQTWLRDILIHTIDPGKMLHADLEAMVPKPEGAWQPAAVLRKLKAVDRARSHMEANGNPRLICETLLMQLCAGA